MCEEYQLSFFFILLLLTQRDQASQGLAIPTSTPAASQGSDSLASENITQSALPSTSPPLFPSNPPQEDEDKDKLHGSVTAAIVIDAILLFFLLYTFIFLLHAGESSRFDENTCEPFFRLVYGCIVVTLSLVSVLLDSIDCLSAALVFYVCMMPTTVAEPERAPKWLLYIFLLLFLTMMGSSLYFIVVWGDKNIRVGAALGMNFVVVVGSPALTAYDIWVRGRKGSSDCITPAETAPPLQNGAPTQVPPTALSVLPPAEQSQSDPTQSLAASSSADDEEEEEAGYGTPTYARLNTTAETAPPLGYGAPTYANLNTTAETAAPLQNGDPTQSLPASSPADDDTEEEEITVPKCSVCLTKNCKVAFICGHQTCKGCVGELSLCPICRAPITHIIILHQQS